LKKGVHCDSYFKEGPDEPEPRNMQFMIREYVSKAMNKRSKKRICAD
jgi:hypothetical protein